jgi:8-oxo-dGTP pyrophosphatase MutT (NUDIX family)
VARIVDLLRERLDPPRPDPQLPDGVPAGVMVPVIDAPDPVLVFTRRSQDVRDHKGEISFPGGVRHGEDPDLLTTALRETEEELGIPRDAFDVLGVLPPTHTMVTGYVIVPFVGRLTVRPEYVPSAVEIDEILEFEVSRLQEVEQLVHREAMGEKHEWFAYELDGHLVWGATGRVLHTLLEVIGKDG